MPSLSGHSASIPVAHYVVMFEHASPVRRYTNCACNHAYVPDKPSATCDRHRSSKTHRRSALRPTYGRCTVEAIELWCPLWADSGQPGTALQTRWQWQRVKNGRRKSARRLRARFCLCCKTHERQFSRMLEILTKSNRVLPRDFNTVSFSNFGSRAVNSKTTLC